MPQAVWPRYAAPRAPAPVAGHCWLVPFRRLSNTQRQVWLSLCGVSGSCCAQGFVWALWAFLAGLGFESKWDFTPPTTILLGLLLCSYIFLVGSNILLPMVVQQWVVILEFSQQKMSACPSTPSSCVGLQKVKYDWKTNTWFHPGGSVSPPAKEGDTGDVSLITVSGIFPERGNGYSLQYEQRIVVGYSSWCHKESGTT